MTNTMIKAAMALTVAGAVALPASQAAAGTSKTESALLGALLGGVAGAAVGNGKTQSVAIGAVAGAALGVAVDKSNDRKHYRSGYGYRQSQPYYGNSNYRSNDRGYYGRTNSRYGYDNDRYGYRR
ncbi:MAG: glycine zipper 2TM domain-containing protein [Alphaproteobacteria bacterium]|nr:glycine zipper 2TM domain-containing protein [Alphaproteobacteria bacterium]MBU1513326.1 glycine zipper 2TM domain-containing protein [Alphaproteobacteria bacterium]MBU2096318.1 glycine zipper 2TM domain-containing protein [Alphaproteobacteria bacterium]MBU2154029.1 glycine zipper 2TM domain-containing protein [Alphaproteobacteria bacterium]MBU2309949.1 glycine zipper 2TM domain-containing protein [Alphaproteobacteria bacterium]